MATMALLTSDLFNVGQCYSMSRNGRNIKFKAISYDAITFGWRLKEASSTLDIFQLEDFEVQTIKRIDCSDFDEPQPGEACEIK
jgi:hypothetical protein